MRNITELFFAAAAKHAKRAAIIEQGRTITYGELARQVESTAAHFQAKGLRAGDRVLVLVPMGTDLYRIVLALFRMGATAVFLDAWVGRKRMELCCQLADCRAWVGGGWKIRALSLISPPLRRMPIKLGIGLPAEGRSPLATVDPDTTALITFTTGSTGIPKAARRSHGFLAKQFEALLDELRPTDGDVDLTTLPIVLFINLGLGSTTVIPDFKPGKPELFNAAAVARQIEQHRVDRMTASPIHVRMLSDHLIASGIRLPALKKVFTGGAPVFPDDAARMVQALPEARCTIVYGSTEAEPIASIAARELAERYADVGNGLCVGPVFHRTQLRIIGITDAAISTASAAEFAQLALPDGEIGEIVVAGEHVLASYFNNEEAFRRNKMVVAGTVWHRTGDSGHVKNGLLYLTGRCAQLIRREDTVLAPFVWEHRLSSEPGVVHGTLIEHRGRIIAVVQAAADADKQVIHARIKSLSGTIEEVVFIARMPMDPRHRSKIDHERVRGMLPRELSR